MLPAPSTPALGNPELRIPPASPCSMRFEIVTAEPQLEPPLVELNADRPPVFRSTIGTTTVPLGWTSGCPPMPARLPGGRVAGLQVSPPSVDVLMKTRSPSAGLSHST